MVVCKCSECIYHHYFDMGTRSLVPGQSIPHNMHLKHLRADRSRQIIAEHYASATTVLPPSDELIVTKDDTDAAVSIQDVPSQNIGEVKNIEPIHPEKEEPLTPPPENLRTAGRPVGRRQNRASILKNIKEYISIVPSESFRESVFQKKLDFRFPPHQHLEEPETGLEAEMFDLALNSDSPNNYAIQNHERILHEHLQMMQVIQTQGLGSSFERARAKLLIPRVKEELERSVNIRRECWLRMRESSLIQGQVAAGTHMPHAHQLIQ